MLSAYTIGIDQEIFNYSQSLSRYIISLSTAAIGLSFTVQQFTKDLVFNIDLITKYLFFFSSAIFLGILFEFLNFIKLVLSKTVMYAREKLPSLKEEENILNNKIIDLKSNGSNDKLQNLEEIIKIQAELIKNHKIGVNILQHGIYTFKLSLISYVCLFLEYFSFMIGVIYFVYFIILRVQMV